ncbi:MAG TPA: 50S ribosomal protein L3 [Ignavibacteriaceae bacterium]|nr:50S ribosomal protein L3 [Ignavibacteriaceae bacterium]
MPGLIGKKIGMSNIFDANGELVPVTVIEAGPCKVVSVRTKEKNGYEALQLGFGSRKEKNISKPLMGQYKKSGTPPVLALNEFKFPADSNYKIGDEIKVDLFQEGEKIKVRGKSKGKGFQGVVRRHHFSGIGMVTHGQSDRVRAPGSIGASSHPSRVFRGQRMAGRMGYDNVTISNLKVVKIVPEQNLIMIKGAVPGSINSIVELIKK